jgi:hypothetical protein
MVIETVQIAGILMAALALLWGVYVWVQDRPVLGIKLDQNIVYIDGKVESEEKLEGVGLKQQLAMYLRLTIKNTGRRATSLIETRAMHNGKSKTGLTAIGDVFELLDGTRPPIKIEPGDYIEFRCEMELLAPLREQGEPFIQLEFSHRKKPQAIRIGS